MKHFFRLLILSLFISITLYSCDRMNTPTKSDKYPVALYKGNQWDVIQLNDSIVTLIPGLNGSKEAVPIVVNIKNLNKQELSLEQE